MRWEVIDRYGRIWLETDDLDEANELVEAGRGFMGIRDTQGE